MQDRGTKVCSPYPDSGSEHTWSFPGACSPRLGPCLFLTGAETRSLLVGPAEGHCPGPCGTALWGQVALGTSEEATLTQVLLGTEVTLAVLGHGTGMGVPTCACR